MASPKIVVCGAGFLGLHISRVLLAAGYRVQLSSRNPARLHNLLKSSAPNQQFLTCVPADITRPSTLKPAFENASTVISLVGILHGTTKQFEDIQWKGAENVARSAQEAGANLVHFSAIGADPNSKIHYQRTKALGEQAALDTNCRNTVIVRPSLVFGPEDDFFNRFSRLSKFMPFLPVFGGGTSRFQPVYVGDIARAVEILCRKDPVVISLVNRKIIEAGGPDILAYKDIMRLVLKYNGRRRLVVSLPFPVGTVIGAFSEILPTNLFTITRAQVEQLKHDNLVNPKLNPATHFPFDSLLLKFSSSDTLKSVDDILPSYFV
ncbi:hypothetical protein C8J56DRAFT_920507 [Mycena floridula]|nr:hypothetical protein C8J56DRAFT_920507 [Mycena floridula]